jgi:hypothetical protein
MQILTTYIQSVNKSMSLFQQVIHILWAKWGRWNIQDTAVPFTTAQRLHGMNTVAMPKDAVTRPHLRD